jgi:hypothetical protein
MRIKITNDRLFFLQCNKNVQVHEDVYVNYRNNRNGHEPVKNISFDITNCKSPSAIQ